MFLDFNLPPIDHINVLASNGFEGEVNGHKTYFYGRCPDCMKKKAGRMFNEIFFQKVLTKDVK